MPKLAVQRLSLSHEFDVVGADVLGFGPEHAASLFDRRGLALCDSHLETALAVCAGWPAALGFASDALLGDDPGSDTAAMIEGATAAYIAEEIVDHHPDHVRDFLDATAVVDDLTVGLARRLSGRVDAGALLHYFRDNNTLVAPVDTTPPAVRYHPLLRAVLRERLAANDPDRLAALHGASSAWFEAEGNAVVAIEHAAKAGDTDSVERLVRAHTFALVARGHGAALQRALSFLAADALDRPYCRLAVVAVLLATGELAAADALLDRAGVQEPIDPRLEALEASVRLHRARFGGDLGVALSRAAASSAGHTGDAAFDVDALVHQGYAHLYSGSPPDAEVAFQRALTIAHGRDDFTTIQCLLHLSIVSAARSDLDGLAALGTQALELAERRGWQDRPVCAFAHIDRCWPAFLRLDDERARQSTLAAVAAQQGTSDPYLRVIAEGLLAIVSFEHDRRAEHLEQLRLTSDQFTHELLATTMLAFLSPYEARMCFRLGRLDLAASLVERLESRLGECGETWLCRAMVTAQNGDLPAAESELARVLAAPEAARVNASLLEARLLAAELSIAQGAPNRAAREVNAALALAREPRIYRPFLASSTAVRELTLAVVDTTDPAPPEQLRLVTALRALTADLPSITARELDLLRALQVRHEVVVEPTLAEAAADLFISANTAKSHLRSIYRKLGVRTRDEAVALVRRARPAVAAPVPG